MALTGVVLEMLPVAPGALLTLAVAGVAVLKLYLVYRLVW